MKKNHTKTTRFIHGYTYYIAIATNGTLEDVIEYTSKTERNKDARAYSKLANMFGKTIFKCDKEVSNG